ncbi:MAG: hypothetical protein C4519_24430 [Desulfobacteraceae bacterium]|nr:MAG: hypothetical protein C4519_24430 [Desulfobacteraceae bacterium]
MKIHCPNCGYEGEPKTKKRGSCLLLIFLFMFFIIPGVFYLLWMASNNKKICPKCGYEHIYKI